MSSNISIRKISEADQLALVEEKILIECLNSHMKLYHRLVVIGVF